MGTGKDLGVMVLLGLGGGRHRGWEEEDLGLNPKSRIIGVCAFSRVLGHLSTYFWGPGRAEGSKTQVWGLEEPCLKDSTRVYALGYTMLCGLEDVLNGVRAIRALV